MNEFAALMQDLKGRQSAHSGWATTARAFGGYQYGFARDWQLYYSDGVFARARLTIPRDRLTVSAFPPPRAIVSR